MQESLTTAQSAVAEPLFGCFQGPFHRPPCSSWRMASRLASVLDLVRLLAQLHHISRSYIPGHFKENKIPISLTVYGEKGKDRNGIHCPGLSLPLPLPPPWASGRRHLCRVCTFFPQNGCCDVMVFPVTWLYSLRSLIFLFWESQRSGLGLRVPFLLGCIWCQVQPQLSGAAFSISGHQEQRRFLLDPLLKSLFPAKTWVRMEA